MEFPNLLQDRSDRPRLDYEKLAAHCPELGSRARLLRFRVKDLQNKFQRDANYAQDAFNLVTKWTLAVSLVGVVTGLLIALIQPKSEVAIATSLAIAGIAALAAAGTKAFGWHKQYAAMFHARWAMTALGTEIDHVLLDIALSTPAGTELSEENRERLNSSTEKWLKSLSNSLNTFGSNYGLAFAPIELKPNITRT